MSPADNFVRLTILTTVLHHAHCSSVDSARPTKTRVSEDTRLQFGQSDDSDLPGAADSIHWQRGQDSFEVVFDGLGDDFVSIRRSVRSSIAEPWPLPRVYQPTIRLFRLFPGNFTIHVKPNTCDVIDDAVQRYRTTLFEDSIEVSEENYFHAPKSKITSEMDQERYLNFVQSSCVPHLHIQISTPCSAYPNAASDESYELTTSNTELVLEAAEVWGALRGLETLSQLVVIRDGQFYVREATIRDSPRFTYRGLLLDTARHFITKDVILDVLEGMAQNKMNVLHWHMVDDQSFPYKSDKFPDLSNKGAYHPSMVYTRPDIVDIIEFARLRGIRVIPEFDTPGHSYTWGFSYPELLTQCYIGKAEPVPGFLGPMDPSNEKLFTVLSQFFKEVISLFKDPYVHLGNDEVLTRCWASNPKVVELFQTLYKENGMERLLSAYVNRTDNTANASLQLDIRLLNREMRTMLETDQDERLPKYVWEYYIKRLRNIFHELADLREEKMEFIMWEDALAENVKIPRDTIIQVWRTDINLRRVLLSGYRAIYSYCWYLDRIDTGVHWQKFYLCDPYEQGRYHNDKSILGGEMCMWGELMSNEMLMKWLWPRGSAVAERLWSRREVKDPFTAARRLAEHRCRMLRRGLDAGFANGPEFCLRKAKSRKSHMKHRIPLATTNDSSDSPGSHVFRRPIFVPGPSVWRETDSEVLLFIRLSSLAVVIVMAMILYQRKAKWYRKHL